MPWTCSVCGELHEEPMRDVRLGLPEDVFELDEDERRARSDFGDDFGWLDDAAGTRFFVRAVLHVPIAGSGDDFRYGVWVEVDAPDFQRLGELWHDPEGSETRPVFARLANELHPYSGTVGLPVAIQLREVRLLPAAIVVSGEHELGRAQREGISTDQANRLAETVLH